MRHLIFWKGIEDASFRRTDEGDVFFPYGVLGAGYVVDTAQKAALVAFLRNYYATGTILVVAGAFAGGFGSWRGLGLFLPALLGIAIYFHIRIRGILGSAAKSRNRMSFGDSQRAIAQQMTNGRLVALLAINILFVVACAFFTLLALTTTDRAFQLGAAGMLLFFGLCLFVNVRLARFKWAGSAG